MIGTASSLERLFACPASAVLPQNDVGDKWAERGTAIHRYRKDVADIGVIKALEQVPTQYRDACEALNLDDVPEHAIHECAFAYNLRTGKARHLIGCHDRNYKDYNLKPTEICGTADVVWRTEGPNRVTVKDYKSGQGKRVNPATVPTMRFYGLCAMLAFGCDCCTLIYTNTDLGTEYTGDMDLFEAFEFTGELKAHVANIKLAATAYAKGEPLHHTEGAHCRYCPAQEHCTPKQKLAAYMTDENGMSQEIEIAWRGALTPATAGRAYRQWRSMEQLTKRASDIIHAYAREHTIELGDGRVFGAREKNGNERVDGDAAFGVIDYLYGMDVAFAATERKTSKKRIREALNGVVLKGGRAAAEKAVLGAIRDAGGITRKTSTVVDEHKETK